MDKPPHLKNFFLPYLRLDTEVAKKLQLEKSTLREFSGLVRKPPAAMVGGEEARVMNLAEVLHTCSHSGVAEAALFSMGGTVAARVFAAAERRCVPRGALVAHLDAKRFRRTDRGVALITQPMLDRLAP